MYLQSDQMDDNDDDAVENVSTNSDIICEWNTLLWSVFPANCNLCAFKRRGNRHKSAPFQTSLPFIKHDCSQAPINKKIQVSKKVKVFFGLAQ